MESDDIKEGFLCPMCLKDLRSASLLRKHFEDSHSDDKDTLRHIRGMFEKNDFFWLYFGVRTCETHG